MNAPVPTLLIANSFPPATGGIENLLFRIAQNSSRLELIVLAPDMPGAADFDRQLGFEVVRLSGDGGSLPTRVRSSLTYRLAHPAVDTFFRYWRTARRLVRQRKVAVVQCGHIYAGFIGYCLKLLEGVPYITYIYGQEASEARLPQRRLWSSWLGRAALTHADAVVVICEFGRSLVAPWVRDPARIVKIHLGADPEAFSPGEPDLDPDLLRHLAGRPVLFSVGRLVERKGFDNVLRAMSLVLEQFSDAVYLLGGSGSSEGELRSLVVRLDLEEHVIFTGRIPDEMLREYYRACDVFVMPSRDLDHGRSVEGLPLVYLEAAACAVPVIGGDTGGIRDAIVDGVTGLVVDPENIKEIADAIIRLLGDPAYALKLGTNGRARVEREMNWQQGATEVESLLMRILESAI